MKPHESRIECQIPCLQSISEGDAEVGPQSLRKRLSVALKRHLTPRMKRTIKTYSNRLIDWFLKVRGRGQVSFVPVTKVTATSLKAGDLIRVRSEEIQATLSYWKEFKGCVFLEYMWPYCDTTQRVLKPMEKFLDERDYRVKKCKGIVLLEGVLCHGTPAFGRCDRACFFFWREEWLEKLD